MRELFPRAVVLSTAMCAGSDIVDAYNTKRLLRSQMRDERSGKQENLDHSYRYQLQSRVPVTSTEEESFHSFRSVTTLIKYKAQSNPMPFAETTDP